MIHRIRKTFLNNEGFSLIEIIVAMAIGTIIMIMINTAHRSILRSVRDVTGVAEFHENVNLAIRRMDRDIESMMIRPTNKFLAMKGSNQPAELKRGILSFITVNSHEFVIEGSLGSEVHETDVKSIKYYLRPDKKYPGVNFLMRAEKNLYDTKDDDTSNDPDIPQYESLVLENVVDLQFDFMADTQWENKWDNLNPPKQVKTTIRVKNYRGTEETYTFISLPSSARL
jgi:prepilin-type N-terminal cleavage/methylation domain-containing protein